MFGDRVLKLMINFKLTKKIGSKQSGFTLVEVMVSTAVAAISMAGVISVFANSVQSNSESLQQIRLNQELRAIMGVMSRDIRRAGYWANADGVAINPFSNGNAAMSVNGAGDCLIYSYDMDDSGALSAGDYQGVKLVGNSVMLRQSNVNCADNGANNWDVINDTTAINITNLNFAINTNACINVTNGGSDCNNASGGDLLRTMNVVTITLAGQLVGDADVNDTLVETVSVRNSVTVTQ